MAIRPDEKRAADSLQAWLQKQNLKASWEADADPRDVCISVAGERWAAEMTSLYAYAEWDGNERNTADLEAAVNRLEAKLAKLVPGESNVGYILEVAGPFPMRMLDKIEERAAAFIKGGKAGEECLDLPEWLERELDGVPEEARRDPKTIEALEEAARGWARFYISASDVVHGLTSITWFHASANLPDGYGFAGNIRARFGIRRRPGAQE